MLSGLPDTAMEAAAKTAAEDGNEGWTFTLDMPSYGPFITYADNRNLRKQMFMARNTLCVKKNDENNVRICRDIINTKLKLAQLLGYQSYADYALKRRMAETPQRVNKFLDDLLKAYKPAAKREMKAIETMAQKYQKRHISLKPWDISYYTHKLKKKRYDIDAEMLRPYLKLENVISGVFALATRLYGITFKENTDIPVYHPDVKAYEVYDHDGSYLAVLYADFHPRKGKQGGAWMTQYQGQYITRKGENIRPHVSLVMNFTKPTDSKPSLLTLGEVQTFLHEFGHALHGIFSNTRYESLSGTNVLWDFVELPSQFMENYALEKEFLHTFAHHYETGELIPDTLVDKVIKSRNFMAGMAGMRQLSFGILDMAYFTRTSTLKTSIQRFEHEAWQKAIITPQAPSACMTVQFGHIMSGGYSAGYYSYKWAEALEADVFAEFKKHGIFNRQTAQRFRDTILSRGATDHPLNLCTAHQGGTKEATIKQIKQTKLNMIMPQDKQYALDLRYLRMARIWAENSYCKRRQVGALVVKDKMIISDGYNGTPSGFENICEDDSNTTKPYVLHAEANAITKLARSENNSDGATIYITASPCIECAKLIIQAGIKRVVYGEQYRLEDGIRLLEKAGIEVIYLNPDSNE